MVFQGNQVVTETWEVAIFQDMGSAPATMEAGKTIDAYGCFPGHSCEQADAEQAYIQADLTGTETWVWLPEEAWEQAPTDVREAFYKRGLRRPVVRLRKALYGHPDAGTFWERHCDERLQQVGFAPVATSWPSCYYNDALQLYLVVYVDDFKLAGPKGNLKKGWDLTRDRARLNIEEPAPAHKPPQASGGD